MWVILTQSVHLAFVESKYTGAQIYKKKVRTGTCYGGLARHRGVPHFRRPLAITCVAMIATYAFDLICRYLITLRSLHLQIFFYTMQM
ncbi:MAG: hypothetical protein ACLU80_04810 [Dorea sp.]